MTFFFLFAMRHDKNSKHDKNVQHNANVCTIVIIRNMKISYDNMKITM